MKNIKYIILLLLSIGFMHSCDLVNNETTLDENDKGNNLASFEKGKIIYSQVATGDEYTFDVEMKVKGPTWLDLKSDVPVTILVDDATTAVEGTNYRIDNNKLTLKADGNYLGKFQVTMLTDGIVAPLAKDPKLVLRTKVEGVENVVGDGKPLEIDLVYGCLSHFEGTYDVTTVYTDYDGNVFNLTWTEDITKNGVESYRTTRVGHWTPADLGGTPGFTFLNKCDLLTVPGQNLVDTYGNWVEGTGNVDDATGNIHIEYTICYPQGSDHCRKYVCDYVKQ